MNIRDRIKSGLNGDYKGLSNGLDRINKYIFGVQKKCYYLLGGQSGTFKTTLADFMLISALIDADKQGIKMNVYYYSFEIDEITKKCNWLSNIAYIKYKKSIPPEVIKGLGDNRLTAEEQLIIDNCIEDLEVLWAKIKFVFRPTNPTGIYNDLWKAVGARGTFEYEDYINDKDEKKKRVISFTLNDEKEVNLLVIDHLYLLKKERGFSPKEFMDKMSEYNVELRNTLGMSMLIVQQFNQGLSSVERQKFKGADLSPSQGDFRDSTNPYQDADVVLGIMNPGKLDMEECMGYDLNQIENMILLKIIKNRLSSDNIAIGLQANPKAGNFTELPPANIIDYSKFKI